MASATNVIKKSINVIAVLLIQSVIKHVNNAKKPSIFKVISVKLVLILSTTAVIAHHIPV